MNGHAPHRKRLPACRPGLTIKGEACGFEYYVTVNFYPETVNPGEVFVTIAKEGSDLSGMFNVFSITLSIMLQYSVPWTVLFKKFSHSRFGLNTDETNPSILHAVMATANEIIQRYTSLWGEGEGETDAVGHGQGGGV